MLSIKMRSSFICIYSYLTLTTRRVTLLLRFCYVSVTLLTSVTVVYLKVRNCHVIALGERISLLIVILEGKDDALRSRQRVLTVTDSYWLGPAAYSDQDVVHISNTALSSLIKVKI